MATTESRLCTRGLTFKPTPTRTFNPIKTTSYGLKGIELPTIDPNFLPVFSQTLQVFLNKKFQYHVLRGNVKLFILDFEESGLLEADEVRW